MDKTQSSTVQLKDSFEKYTPFLIELRRRLLFLACVFIISGGLGFYYYQDVLTVVLKIFSLDGVNIVFTSPFQFLNLAITSGLLIGIIIIFPLIIYQILSFLRPALHPKEYKTILALLPLSLLLFLTGFGFGVVMMKYVVILFYEKSVDLSIGNMLDISLLLSQIIITSMMMGLAFQFPIVLTILMRLKIVKYRQVVKQRPLVYMSSLLFAALLPPTDLFSLVLLFLPLAILFEVTLLLNKWLLKSHLL